MSETTGAFDLIETMAFDPASGLPMLERHISRMQASADKLGFRFDRHALRNELQAATFSFVEAMRVRVLLSRAGNMAVEVRPHAPWPQAIMQVSIVPRLLGGDDLRIHHKTTDRRHYEEALRRGGTFEVLLLDEAGYLTEGCFSTIFVERGDRLLTPPLSRGLLPGVLRQNLLDMGEAEEADLKPRDLEGGFFIGNASRGMVAASVVARRG
ncbi:aminotransferase class IV [Sphingobium lignivorans]|uniref:Probable branched-chain-amino-acid aminotransferase n=1 Tax=Sphingobium lignivorans TaxID=2735886 RepID=A0ABR6NML6_9SPHN|nr:4-amino-4-deoxychorismate lyase/para-aminobenzoate synthetase/4-amino-4-deoxychorismate lyase [Sphingobium lignivorans]